MRGGIKFSILVFFLLVGLSSAVSASTLEYGVIVSEPGDSLVVLNLEGQGTTSLPLPLDVVTPEVSGALYVQSSTGIDVYVGQLEKATVVYGTSLYTSKLNDTWTFEMELPAKPKTVILSLPKNAEVLSTTPDGVIEQKRDSTNVNWETGSGITTVTATYKLGKSTLGFSPYYIVILFVGIAAGYLFFVKGKGLKLPKKTTKQSSAGKEKKNVLRALTDNESKIVNLLLENSGELKRNRLEKSSGLAKSSLASVLNNLEKRNIVSVDRSYTVHIVELSDWFKSL